MTGVDFEALVEKRIVETRRRLRVKGEEYGGDDRLIHFRRMAELTQNPVVEVCGVLLAKHLVSVFDIIDAASIENHWASMIDEKVGDAICYLVLLEAVLSEIPGAKEEHR
jgi:hypothetical protein